MASSPALGDKCSSHLVVYGSFIELCGSSASGCGTLGPRSEWNAMRARAALCVRSLADACSAVWRVWFSVYAPDVAGSSERKLGWCQPPSADADGSALETSVAPPSTPCVMIAPRVAALASDAL